MLSVDLLAWYDIHRRRFPWRALAGHSPNPFHVWLSEIMLQQTQTGAVISFFNAFTQKWPTVQDLATADLDEVLHAWQGLGYYSRARSLHKAAKILQTDFPQTEAQWLQIPGVGPYTAGAITAIAYGHPSSPVDGNIARVFSRLHQIEEVKPALYITVKNLLQKEVHSTRNGDFIQALMDIGATICLPKTANCNACPLQIHCLSFKSGTPERYPLKATKPERPTRYGTVFWIEDKIGRVCIQKRPEKGLLGGMMEFPSTPWESENVTNSFKDGSDLNLTVQHTFTHFHLILKIMKLAADKAPKDSLWVNPADFKNYALPTLMKKVAGAVLNKKTTPFLKGVARVYTKK